jgi:Holliday junction resolvasome RuvABC ATP-dependent DNA helicase subunit
MTNEEIARFFNDTRAFIQGNPDLRDPQVEMWFRTRQHFWNSLDHAILQIPVGCGKTGLVALLPFEIAQGQKPCDCRRGQHYSRSNRPLCSKQEVDQ